MDECVVKYARAAVGWKRLLSCWERVGDEGFEPPTYCV